MNLRLNVPMDPEVRRRWTAALRSGEFQQGRGKLAAVEETSDERRYCCLGVLCELAARDGVVTVRDGVDWVSYMDNDGPMQINYLPRAVASWAGLSSTNPRIRSINVSGDTPTLSYLNDSGYTFDQIADVIDAEFS